MSKWPIPYATCSTIWQRTMVQGRPQQSGTTPHASHTAPARCGQFDNACLRKRVRLQVAPHAFHGLQFRSVRTPQVHAESGVAVHELGHGLGPRCRRAVPRHHHPGLKLAERLAHEPDDQSGSCVPIQGRAELKTTLPEGRRGTPHAGHRAPISIFSRRSLALWPSLHPRLGRRFAFSRSGRCCRKARIHMGTARSDTSSFCATSVCLRPACTRATRRRRSGCAGSPRGLTVDLLPGEQEGRRTNINTSRPDDQGGPTA